jgi:hypothetical protein
MLMPSWESEMFICLFIPAMLTASLALGLPILIVCLVCLHTGSVGRHVMLLALLAMALIHPQMFVFSVMSTVSHVHQ